MRDFYKNHQGQIDRCINKVFGEKYDGTPDIAATIMPRQTIRNGPELDVSLTQFQLQGYTQHDNTQGTWSLAGDRGHGTVYIASDLYARISLEEKQRTYFHEMGNILSGQRATTPKGYPDARAFGDPRGIGKNPDYDTGARLEKCIFGSVPF